MPVFVVVFSCGWWIVCHHIHTHTQIVQLCYPTVCFNCCLCWIGNVECAREKNISIVLSVFVVHWLSDLKYLCLNLTVVSFICNRCNFTSVLFLKVCHSLIHNMNYSDMFLEATFYLNEHLCFWHRSSVVHENLTYIGILLFLSTLNWKSERKNFGSNNFPLQYCVTSYVSYVVYCGATWLKWHWSILAIWWEFLDHRW